MAEETEAQNLEENQADEEEHPTEHADIEDTVETIETPATDEIESNEDQLVEAEPEPTASEENAADDNETAESNEEPNNEDDPNPGPAEDGIEKVGVPTIPNRL